MSHDPDVGAGQRKVAEIEAEIARIRALGIDELRSLWRVTFKAEVPEAFTKDLIARMLARHIQEQVFGTIDRAMSRLLEGFLRGAPKKIDGARRLKSGTVLVREYHGERHTVTVVLDGFAWQGTIYRSLTTIARVITGTNWNGPRFFGLRVAGDKVAHTSVERCEEER